MIDVLRVIKLSAVHVVAALGGFLLLAAGTTWAQVGAPIISTGTGTIADPVFLDVAQIDTSDTDICLRIQKAWQALDQKSGVLDARSITGTVGCSTDPFSNATEGILLLGNVVIQTSVPWQIPSHVRVNGLGDPGSFVGQNTLIQAVSGYSFGGNAPYCAAGALVCLGHGSQAFRAEVSNMAIDCNDQPGCIAAYNGAAQEGSWYQGVTLANSGVAGLMISLNQFTNGNNQQFYGAVNSGPYRNISIQYWQMCGNNVCSASTAGVLVQNNSTKNPDFGGVVRDLDNVTISAFNACPTDGGEVCPGTGFLVEGASVNITNSHVEYFQTSIQIGADGYNTNGVEVTNVYLSNTNSNTGVMIWKPNGCTPNPCSTGDVTLSGINYAAAGTGNSLVDQVGGNTLKDLFIAFYALGDQNGTNGTVKPKVISTSNNLTNGSSSAGGGGGPH